MPRKPKPKPSIAPPLERAAPHEKVEAAPRVKNKAGHAGIGRHVPQERVRDAEATLERRAALIDQWAEQIQLEARSGKALLPPLKQLDHTTFIETLDAYRRERQTSPPRAIQPPPWVISRPLPANDAAARADRHLLASVHAVHVDPDQTAWLLRGYIRRSDDKLVLSRVSVEGFPDVSADVTSTCLRNIPVGGILNQALATLRSAETIHIAKAALGWAPAPDDEHRARRAAEEAIYELERGRQGYPREHYRRLALAYVDAVAEGRRDFRQFLAKKLGEWQKREVPLDTLKTQLRVASDRYGFLVSRGRGAKYGPGPNLYRVEEGEGNA